jgi:signal transduction histidine kinase
VQLLQLGVHGVVSDAQREVLARITRAQEHLLTLVDDVLGLARLEAGGTTFRIAPVDLQALVEDVGEMVAGQLAARSLSLVRGTPSASSHALADADRLRQVLLNLLSNAWKCTPAGGTITLGTSVAPDGRLRVQVRDTGIGIPADKLDAIFQPFVQLGTGAGTLPQGSGLGLAISRELVQGMGGELAAESRMGVGSVFTVTLPAAPHVA